MDLLSGSGFEVRWWFCRKVRGGLSSSRVRQRQKYGLGEEVGSECPSLFRGIVVDPFSGAVLRDLLALAVGGRSSWVKFAVQVFEFCLFDHGAILLWRLCCRGIWE